MQFKRILPLVILLLVYMAAPAASVPAKFVSPAPLGDTTLALQVVLEKPSGVKKKPGFFARLKNKVLFYTLKKSLKSGEESKTKIVLGYVGLALLALAFPLGLIASSSALFLAPAIAGFLVSLISVLMPGGNKKNVAGKLAVIIGGILLVLFMILIIAISNIRWG